MALGVAIPLHENIAKSSYTLRALWLVLQNPKVDVLTKTRSHNIYTRNIHKDQRTMLSPDDVHGDVLARVAAKRLHTLSPRPPDEFEHVAVAEVLRNAQLERRDERLRRAFPRVVLCRRELPDVRRGQVQHLRVTFNLCSDLRVSTAVAYVGEE